MRVGLALLSTGILLSLAGCGDGYSPNTYASNAAQVEANVQRGVIIGVRQITISPDGTVGAAAGGAAGGVAGAQAAGAPVVTALGAIGGSLVGGIGGSAAAQAVGKTKGWEYIVDETPGDKLVSVTQTSKAPLAIGLHVLVIAGTQQARIVPDYTVQIAAAPAAKPEVKPETANGADVEMNVSAELPPPDAAAAAAAAPAAVANDPAGAPPPETPATKPGGAAAEPDEAAAGTLPAGATAAAVQVGPGTAAAPAGASAIAN